MGCFMLYLYGHNPYFNRWFSAIVKLIIIMTIIICHNPYFNRWFSAIEFEEELKGQTGVSQSLF